MEVYYNSFSFNTSITIVLGIWGQVSVAVFVVISAYYQCDKAGIRSFKLFYIIRKTVFLTGFIYGLGIVIGIIHVSVWDYLKIFVKMILSPFNNTYWYITSYIIYYLSIPALQVIVTKTTKQKLRSLCITLAGAVFFLDFVKMRIGGAVLDFCCLFLITAYCKKYKQELLNSACIKMFRISAAGIVLCCVLCNVIYSVSDNGIFIELMPHFFVGWNPLIIVCALSLFWIFKAKRYRFSKAIRIIAQTSLGVYILSENPVMRMGGLWCKWFKLEAVYIGSPIFFICFIGAGMIVWTVCVLIEFLGIRIIEHWVLIKSDMKVKNRLTKLDQRYFYIDEEYI